MTIRGDRADPHTPASASPKDDRIDDVPYSARSALTGSTRLALRAGR